LTDALRWGNITIAIGSDEQPQGYFLSYLGSSFAFIAIVLAATGYARARTRIWRHIE